MQIHSKFLIHWTGKDITSNKPSKLSRQEINNFIERLKSIVKEGLYMGKGTEKIYGKNNTFIKIHIPRICFTEIKLSQAEMHAREYGLLGIGFNRKFILLRYGNPVFYVQNGKNGIVIENLDFIHKYCKNNSTRLKELEVILGFLKNMSDKDSDKLIYYDEMEWRILHSDLLEKKGYIVTANKGSRFLLKIKPRDIKIIVFPSYKVRNKALGDEWLNKHLFTKHIPTITTISDCKNF